MSSWASKFIGRSRVGSSRTGFRSTRGGRNRRLACESLEGRTVMTGLGVDYTLMGGQWDNSKPISFSIAPDGVSWDQAANNVNSQLNGEFNGTSWQKLVAEALQTWAASSNLNFTETGDGAYGFNTSGQSQGDPRFGDIRVGGYAFASSTIAQTYGPPPNGSTAGGDVELNTNYNFGPSGQYDLETVLIHEVGHSLGLGESPQPSSLMYSYYSGVRHDLGAADVEGIQSIYGPRVADLFQSKGEANSATNAVDLSGTFSAGQSQVNGLSLASIGDTEYFSVTVPSVQGATLHISAAAHGQSLLSPKVTVIDAATGATLSVDAHPDQYGDTASVSVPNAQAGHRYLIVVTGATQDEFAVGNYSLQLAYSGGTTLASPTAPQTPVATPPTTPVATPSNPTTTPKAPTTATPVATSSPSGGGNQATQAPVADRYSGNTSFANAAQLGSISGQSIIGGLSLRSGQDIRVFSFEPATSGLVFLASANATIVVGDALGRPVAVGRGLIGFQALQAGARYFVIILSPNSGPVGDASFAIQVVPMASLNPTLTTNATNVTVGQPTPTSGTTSVAPTSSKNKKRHRGS